MAWSYISFMYSKQFNKYYDEVDPIANQKRNVSQYRPMRICVYFKSSDFECAERTQNRSRYISLSTLFWTDFPEILLGPY